MVAAMECHMRQASLPNCLSRGTFRDMQAQRDHLRDVVFPELAERLRARRHHLEQVDLRWGVVATETEGEEMPPDVAGLYSEERRPEPGAVAAAQRLRDLKGRPASSSLLRRGNPDGGPSGRSC